jgi:hypothetical protein
VDPADPDVLAVAGTDRAHLDLARGDEAARVLHAGQHEVPDLSARRDDAGPVRSHR